MIARGFAAEARLLVLDEPTASLTEEEIKHLHAVVRSCATTGVAIIYVTTAWTRSSRSPTTSG